MCHSCTWTYSPDISHDKENSWCLKMAASWCFKHRHLAIRNPASRPAQTSKPTPPSSVAMISSWLRSANTNSARALGSSTRKPLRRWLVILPAFSASLHGDTRRMRTRLA
jgi:hypothetical protein